MSNSFKFRHGDWDNVKRGRPSERIKNQAFEIDQIHRLYNEEHKRTKPKLVAVNSTGGFKLNQKHK